MLSLSYNNNPTWRMTAGFLPAGTFPVCPSACGTAGGMAQVDAIMQMMMAMQMLMTLMASRTQCHMLSAAPGFGGGGDGCQGNSLAVFLGAAGSGPTSGGGHPSSGSGPSGSASGGGGGMAQGMTPPSSTGSISSLSPNREQRLRQVVDAAKRTYPDQPHLARLAAAQALLESGMASQRGPSGLARNHNNLFGIKGRGTAGSVNMRTGEHLNGRNVRINDNFARNNTVEDSFQQHRNLMNRPRYRGVVQAQSFEQAARAVQAAGYATAPNYADSLVTTYNTHLARYF